MGPTHKLTDRDKVESKSDSYGGPKHFLVTLQRGSTLTDFSTTISASYVHLTQSQRTRFFQYESQPADLASVPDSWLLFSLVARRAPPVRGQDRVHLSIDSNNGWGFVEPPVARRQRTPGTKRRLVMPV